MTEEEIRLECLCKALSSVWMNGPPTTDAIIERAEAFMKFVLGGGDEPILDVADTTRTVAELFEGINARLNRAGII